MYDLNLFAMQHLVGQAVRQHHFVDNIMEANIPLGWKPLNLERYDETTNPDKHLGAFPTHVNLYTNDNVILCRVFPTSLKGVSLTWYSGLPPRPIDSFDTIIEQFSVQCSTSRYYYIIVAALASLWQANDESLKKFMDRFGHTSIEIQNLNPEVALYSMRKQGLHPDGRNV